VRGGVIVALLGLDLSEAMFLAARANLDQEERRRAASFAFDRDRRRYVLSHFALRQLLSGICDIHTSQLRFATEPLGRPYLQTPSGIDFNMSHSGDISAYAASKTCRVGIDVEMIVPSAPPELAEHVLTPTERDALQQLPVEEHPRVFFRYWTAKEAFLKWHGLGFTVEPQSVTVDLNNGTACCSTLRLAPAHIIWLPAGKHAVCALAAPHAVDLYDVSDRLVRFISMIVPNIGSSSYCESGFIRPEQNLGSQHMAISSFL